MVKINEKRTRLIIDVTSDYVKIKSFGIN